MLRVFDDIKLAVFLFVFFSDSNHLIWLNLKKNGTHGHFT